MTAAKEKIPLDAGPFQLRDLIGSGGFGEVWYGVREEPYFQEVAVKIPRQDRRTDDSLLRFEAERQAMALLNHSNVIRFFEGGTLENGDPYYAMEFVDGLSITDFCDDQELSIKERVALFLEACDGVAFVHEHGILHRDIKPANLIVNESSGDPTVKLIDFGIARCSEFDEMGLVVGQTLDGASLGTRDYSSPEQIDGKHSELDETSDVYSLGAVLCELLSSVKPLDDKTLSESSISQIVNQLTDGASIHPQDRFAGLNKEAKGLAAKKRGGDVKWLAEILKGDLGEIVSRAIAAAPDDRYPTASEFADDLRRYLAGEPINATEHPKSKGQSVRLKQKIFWLTAATALAIAGIFWSVKYFGSDATTIPKVAGVESGEGAATLENTQVKNTMYLCRERMARAQFCWENDDTQECIEEIRRVMADVDAGKLDHFSGRFITQRRNIQCQTRHMLIFCLLETGRVIEAKNLLNELIPIYREKIQIYSESEGRLENAWMSSLAVVLTLRGDAERLTGNPENAVAFFVEATQIVDRLTADPNDRSAGLRGWGIHMGLPHGRLADVMVRPDSLVVSTAQRMEWMVVDSERRSPMELYEAERKILEGFPLSHEKLVGRRIAFTFLKESLQWSDLGKFEKAKECQRSAAEILNSRDSTGVEEWRRFYGLLGFSGELNPRPNLALSRVQYQLLEAERWMLEGTESLGQEDLLKAHEHFTTAQVIADRLAENCPEAPEFLHYSAQMKLRIADKLSVFPGGETVIERLRTLASEALTSLKKLDAENANWNQSMQYASVKMTGQGHR